MIAITSATSDLFSASEWPNVSGWDGTFHELKRGNCKMRFEGQVAGDVNLLDVTFVVASVPKVFDADGI